ncbi:hypothetical protein ACJX0J_011225 [Zea mays]
MYIACTPVSFSFFFSFGEWTRCTFLAACHVYFFLLDVYYYTAKDTIFMMTNMWRIQCVIVALCYHLSFLIIIFFLNKKQYIYKIAFIHHHHGNQSIGLHQDFVIVFMTHQSYFINARLLINTIRKWHGNDKNAIVAAYNKNDCILEILNNLICHNHGDQSTILYEDLKNTNKQDLNEKNTNKYIVYRLNFITITTKGQYYSARYITTKTCINLEYRSLLIKRSYGQGIIIKITSLILHFIGRSSSLNIYLTFDDIVIYREYVDG